MGTEVNAKPTHDRGIMLIATAFVAGIFYKLYRIIRAWVHVHPFWAALIITGLFILMGLSILGLMLSRAEKRKRERDKATLTKKKEGSTFIGVADTGEQAFLPLDSRRTHGQAMGGSGSGKSEGYLMPSCVDDMSKGRGFIFVDGKPEGKTRGKLLGYAQKYNRLSDFQVFDPENPRISKTFNPLIGDTPEEVTQRVFLAFDFKDEYYRNVQQGILLNTLRIFKGANLVPTFTRVLDALKSPSSLVTLAGRGPDQGLITWAEGFSAMPGTEREKRTSGLISQLEPFTSGPISQLVNTERPEIDINRTLSKDEILYMPLPTLRQLHMAQVLGKFILQSIAASAANRQGDKNPNRKLFTVYLDDFAEYIYEGFVTILNKVRSADISIIFSHQALGDLDRCGENVANAIKTNSALKIFMKCPDPDSAEYCSRMAGTKPGQKFTFRTTAGAIGPNQTGDASMRETESFVVSPNIFKNEFGPGDAFLIIPHSGGTVHRRIKFARLPNIDPVDLPERDLPEAASMPAKFRSVAAASVSETAATP